MEKYKLLIDESGNFEAKNERYIIIGGLFFNEDKQEDLEKIFIPLHKHLCTAYKSDELHGKSNKKLYYHIAPIIGCIDYLYSIIFVIDKQKSFIFKRYNGKSFKYNKALEHLIRKMIQDNLLTEKDELNIKIDDINLNDKELINLKKYLPSIYPFVKSVSQENSKYNICLQLSDVIVNKFSKNSICKTSSIEIKLLNPKIYCFLSETLEDYIVENNH